MITVIKNVEVYAPEHKGIQNVVIAADKIEGIYDDLNVPENFVKINVLDGTGKILVPGFVDSHVHIIGGGGEGGFKTRTPEIPLSELIKAGITTVVGCIGTDNVCRDMRELLAKAHALDEEGITTYCYTGSYDIPVKTLTDSIKEDIMLIDKIIGVGEIALSDNRSSQATFQQFVNIVAQARVGGLLAGKAGIVHVHLGDGIRKLEYLFEMIENTEIPARQVFPTHINRSDKLFEVGVEFCKRGGYADLTTSSDPDNMEEGELRASEALRLMLEKEVPEERITFSSDGNGSMPLFNKKRQLVGLGVCSVSSLFSEVKEAIFKERVPFEKAIKVITSNPAEVLNFKHKGRIEAGRDADIVLLEKETLEITEVISRGRILMENKELLAKGTFEK